MDRKELARWGIPALGFIGYVKWGGTPLALAFALILFAVISALISWHRKDPRGFFRGMRVWAVMLVLLPAIGLTLGALASTPLLAVPALALLAAAIWLVRWTSRNASGLPASGTPSMAAQNLEAANDLTRTIVDNGRRSHSRGAQLHVQADNLALIKRNRELEAQSAVLQEQLRAKEREAALPPDPFADPITKA
ncbi:MAG: hypothetical protein V4673_09605 [Pseudomonadota bacterium]